MWRWCVSLCVQCDLCASILGARYFKKSSLRMVPHLTCPGLSYAEFALVRIHDGDVKLGVASAAFDPAAGGTASDTVSFGLCRFNDVFLLSQTYIRIHQFCYGRQDMGWSYHIAHGTAHGDVVHEVRLPSFFVGSEKAISLTPNLYANSGSCENRGMFIHGRKDKVQKRETRLVCCWI